jgi:hypothetical protein
MASSLTVTEVASGRFEAGSEVGFWSGKVKMDTSYDAGGETGISPVALGFSEFYTVQITPDTLAATTALAVSYDWSANKVQLWESGGNGAPQDETTIDNVTAIILDVFVVGVIKDPSLG